MKKTRLFVLGCTGSVGSSVLSVCRAFPERFQISVLAARSSGAAIAKLAVEFSVPTVVITDPQAADKVRNESHGSFAVLSGNKALEEAGFSPRKVFRGFAERGYIESLVDSDGIRRFQLGRSIMGKTCRVYVVKVPGSEEETEKFLE